MSVAAIGLDAGSTTFKGVAVDKTGAILARQLEPTKTDLSRQAMDVLGRLRADAGAGDGVPVAATGYGRKMVGGAGRVITEITAHGKGAFHLAGRGLTLVDVGGQDTKVIRIGDSGRVEDFAMNDKCAAGTGRFLEVILGRLEVGYDQVMGLVQKAEGRVSISSTCTVFAESEIISLLSQGVPVEEIVYGVHRAFAERVGALVRRLGSPAEIHLSGGGAKNGALVRLLGEQLGAQATVLPEAQFVGALGAAISVS